MKLRLCGAEVYLSFALVPFLFVCIIAGETDAFFCAAVSLLLHECAHGVAVKNLGYRIERLSVYPFGAVMRLESLSEQTGQAWIVALAGPLGSFLCASVAKLSAGLLPQQSAWLDRFAATNLAIALLNLLPAYPLDGGQIARQALLKVLKERTANRVLLTLSCVLAAGMLGCGIWLFMRGIHAWTLFALSAFLLGAAVREGRQSALGPVRHAIDRRLSIQAGQRMKVAVIAVHPSTTIGEAVSEIRPTHFTVLRVTDGHQAFELEEGQLIALAARYGYRAQISDVLSDVLSERILFDQSERTCYNKLFEK